MNPNHSARDREEIADNYKKISGRPGHTNTCATSIAPAEEPGPCDCADDYDRLMNPKPSSHLTSDAAKQKVLAIYSRAQLGSQKVTREIAGMFSGWYTANIYETEMCMRSIGKATWPSMGEAIDHAWIDAASSLPSAPDTEVIHEVEPRRPRDKKIYVKTMGSGWFWCHRPAIVGSSDWSVLYINALWGALVDGKYVRTDNFDDVIGPLEAPSEN